MMEKHGAVSPEDLEYIRRGATEYVRFARLYCIQHRKRILSGPYHPHSKEIRDVVQMAYRGQRQEVHTYEREVIAALQLGVAVRTKAAFHRLRLERHWFGTALCFVPKTVREPMLGDLYEEREAWASEGRSRAFIEWATASQLFILVLYLLRDLWPSRRWFGRRP